MMFDNKLVLIVGNDIEIPNYQVKIHQPTINEIAIIGEELFISCFNIFSLNFEEININISDSINDDYIEEKQLALNFSEIETIGFLLNYDDEFYNKFKVIFKSILPEYEIILEDNLVITLIKEDIKIILNQEFFTNIKNIVKEIFIFEKLFGVTSTKPINAKAQEIMDKMNKAKEKIKKQNNNNSIEKNKSLFSNMISILGTQGYSILELNKLTIYQLYNQFERFTLYIQYDQGMKAALAGAKVELVDWFKEL